MNAKRTLSLVALRLATRPRVLALTTRLLRASAVSRGVPCITTLAGAKAALAALERLRMGKPDVFALQDLLKWNV